MQIEEDMSLPPHSITSASWIKKPELRVPNQKTANLKVLCAPADVANKLLRECLLSRMPRSWQGRTYKSPSGAISAMSMAILEKSASIVNNAQTVLVTMQLPRALHPKPLAASHVAPPPPIPAPIGATVLPSPNMPPALTYTYQRTQCPTSCC